MSRAVVFRPPARREFDEAADWYERRRTGLGAKFTAAVQRVVDQAALNPKRYAAVVGGIREGIVNGFPFCVYYKEDGGQIVVLAVFHASRDPSIWQARG